MDCEREGALEDQSKQKEQHECKGSSSGIESWPVEPVRGPGWGGHVESGGKDAGEITSSTLVCKESMRTVVVEKHKGKSKRDFKVESDTLSFMF